ncbi:MAG: hypothetical protein AAF639_23045 [Chloroflexota bacterium]
MIPQTKVPSYTFRQCTLTMLDDLFGVRQTFSSPVLDQWLTAGIDLRDIALSEKERVSVNDLQTLLAINIHVWNEHELLMYFIGPLFNLVRFTDPYRYNLFAQRKIGTVVDGVNEKIELSGEPDGIIATGFRAPEMPMFAFTEYTQGIETESDPAGQTLAAMLVGQTLNDHNTPMYGAYAIGSVWYFMVLKGHEYMISRDYSALTDEVYDILRIFKGLKQIVIQLTA